MRDWLQILVERHGHSGILIDTNILLLLVVGATDKSQISLHKRTKQFAPEDFDVLLRLLDMFPIRVTLPNIMTETINLARQTNEIFKDETSRNVPAILELFVEQYINSGQIVSLEEFITLGLTDTAILESARDQYLVLTDDFKLAGTLTKAGVDVINFNHLRPYF